MTKIFLETSSKYANEYVFIDMLINDILKKDKGLYEIITVGGKDNLKNYMNKFHEYENDTKNNIVLFDADTRQNHGGFENRKKELTKILRCMNVQFELFLFPNNQDDGMFETLLENIVNSKHKRILDCFTCYEKCLEQYNSSNMVYQTPDQKAKIYAYISAFKKSNKRKENLKNKGQWHFECPEYWDLQNEYLYPLKSFLDNKI